MSNLVLYRKYRPLSFGDVVSQEHVKITLQNAVKSSRTGHAYLFTGPRGVGKTSIARIFARAVNCPNQRDGEPCNECEICKEFLAGTSLDVLEIDAASHTGVDNIRELIDHLQFAPTRGKYKVVIIDEVHMLSKGAFNALLKTLEEPPKHAVFVLATTEIHKVPATIVSRTQKFDFKKATVLDLVSRLRFVCEDNNIKASDEALVIVAAAADGSFRDGLSLLDQVFNFTEGELTPELVEDVLGLTGFRTTHDFLDLILASKNSEAVNFVSELMYSGKDLFQFHKDFLEFLRKLLIMKVGAKSDFGFSAEMMNQMQNLTAKTDLARLIRIIEIFQKAGAELRWSSIMSLPLELAVVEAINLEQPSPRTVERPSSVSAKETPAEAAEVSGEPNPEALNLAVANWGKILDKLKDYNHSLIPSLKLAKPVDVTGQVLTVTFPYKFHKDAIEQRKNKIVVDQVIEEVTGLKLLIKPVVEKDWLAENPQAKNSAAPTVSDTPMASEIPESKEDSNLDQNLMESALKIMGGEVE